jgi:hypothetical protein
MTQKYAFILVAVLAAAGLAHAEQSQQVRCKDGTMGTAGRGACSHHGGVAKDDQPAAAAKPTAPATTSNTMVRCKDGTTSEAGRGACSHHGGVDKGATPAPSPTPTTPSTPAAPPVPRTAPTPATPPTPVTPPAPSAEKAPSRPLPPNAVPGGAPANTNAAPTAKCKDGTFSYSKHHTGSCSHHGGVAQWLDGTAPAR